MDVWLDADITVNRWVGLEGWAATHCWPLSDTLKPIQARSSVCLVVCLWDSGLSDWILEEGGA